MDTNEKKGTQMSKRNRNRNESSPEPSDSLANHPALVGESKADALKRLAGKRVPKAVTALRGVANLATYKPTEDQAQKIVASLRMELDAVEQALMSGRRVTAGFQL